MKAAIFGYNEILIELVKHDVDLNKQNRVDFLIFFSN